MRAMSKYYCPDCVEPLIKDRKKLGYITTWLICPKCGFRSRESRLDSEEQAKCVMMMERIEEDNKTGGCHLGENN